MKTIRALIISGLLIGCGSSKTVIKTYTITDFSNLDLKKAISIENKIGSIYKTPKHHISIGDGIYPNKRNFELATPQTFIRDENYFKNEAWYFYSKTDSSVKVILYQWKKKN